MFIDLHGFSGIKTPLLIDRRFPLDSTETTVRKAFADNTCGIPHTIARFEDAKKQVDYCDAEKIIAFFNKNGFVSPLSPEISCNEVQFYTAIRGTFYATSSKIKKWKDGRLANTVYIITNERLRLEQTNWGQVYLQTTAKAYFREMQQRFPDVSWVYRDISLLLDNDFSERNLRVLQKCNEVLGGSCRNGIALIDELYLSRRVEYIAQAEKKLELFLKKNFDFSCEKRRLAETVSEVVKIICERKVQSSYKYLLPLCNYILRLPLPLPKVVLKEGKLKKIIMRNSRLLYMQQQTSLFLAKMYHYGITVPIDFKVALNEYIAACKRFDKPFLAPKEAVTIAKLALEIDGTDSVPLILSKAISENSDIKILKSHLIKDSSIQIKIINKVLSSEPNNFLALISKASWNLNAGKIEEAGRSFAMKEIVNSPENLAWKFRLLFAAKVNDHVARRKEERAILTFSLPQMEWALERITHHWNSTAFQFSRDLYLVAFEAASKYPTSTPLKKAALILGSNAALSLSDFFAKDELLQKLKKLALDILQLEPENTEANFVLGEYLQEAKF